MGMNDNITSYGAMMKDAQSKALERWKTTVLIPCSTFISTLYVDTCHLQGYKQGKGTQFNKPTATLFSKKKELPWVHTHTHTHTHEVVAKAT